VIDVDSRYTERNTLSARSEFREAANAAAASGSAARRGG
jgi:hypothetical protein